MHQLSPRVNRHVAVSGKIAMKDVLPDSKELGTVRHVELKDRFRALRDALHLTHFNIVDAANKAGEAFLREEVVKVEGGKNKATTKWMREKIAAGFQMATADCDAYLDGLIELDEALLRRDAHLERLKNGPPKPYRESASYREAEAVAKTLPQASHVPTVAWKLARDMPGERIRRRPAYDPGDVLVIVLYFYRTATEDEIKRADESMLLEEERAEQVVKPIRPPSTSPEAPKNTSTSRVKSLRGK